MHCIGVPAPLGGPIRQSLTTAAPGLSRVTVRDAESKLHLEALGVTGRVVPDSVWALPTVWPLDVLRVVHRGLVASGRLPNTPYLAVHLSDWQATIDEDIADALATVHDRSLPVVLVPLGPCMGDEGTARQLATRTGTHALLGSNVVERTAAIALSHGYMGMGLHGGIVAAGYGRPTVWLRDNPKVRASARFLGGPRIGRTETLAYIAEDLVRGVHDVDVERTATLAADARREIGECLDELLHGC